LFFHDGESVKQAADYLGVSKSAVSQLAGPLEAKKLVSRANDLGDRRVVRLNITHKGRGLVKELARHKLDGVRTATGSLSDKEVGQLYGLILKMASRNGVSDD
jgi:DNA-binding MarR family transcriptional regulator